MSRINEDIRRIEFTTKKLIGALIVGLTATFTAPLAHAAFQESLWGARPASLVGAYTALADDANSPAYNPAGIGLMTESEITFMYARLFTGVNFYAGEDTSRLGLGYFSYVPTIKDKQYGSYAISWSNFAATNLYREDTFTLTAADSYQFESIKGSPILSYGANLKFLRRAFTTDQRTAQDPVFNSGATSSAGTVDLGIMYRPNWELLPGFKFGMAGQNLTEPNIGLATVDRVPLKLSVGVAYQDPALRLFNPALEISRRRGRTLVTGAWESWLAKDVFALRAGVNSDEMGGGIGYKFRLSSKTVMRLDYGLIWPFNVSGTSGSHRVSITVAF